MTLYAVVATVNHKFSSMRFPAEDRSAFAECSGAPDWTRICVRNLL